MTEDQAQEWLSERVPRETMNKLALLIELVKREAEAQNLISASTWNHKWARHVVDSAQLERSLHGDTVLDIGSGAGFPGLVLAILRDSAFILAEPRRRRAEFLTMAITDLALHNARVVSQRCERLIAPPFASIVARAVAPLGTLFAIAEHLADGDTPWVLPKGRSAQSELAAARETWHGDFRMVNSITDPEAAIIVATNVRRKARTGR